jgi:hypothetical protein
MYPPLPWALTIAVHRRKLSGAERAAKTKIIVSRVVKAEPKIKNRVTKFRDFRVHKRIKTTPAAMTLVSPNSRLFRAVTGNKRPRKTNRRIFLDVEKNDVDKSKQTAVGNKVLDGIEKNDPTIEPAKSLCFDPFIKISELAYSKSTDLGIFPKTVLPICANIQTWTSVKTKSQVSTADIIVEAEWFFRTSRGHPNIDVYCVAKSPSGVIPVAGSSNSLNTVEEAKRSMIPPENCVIEGK